MDGLAVEQSGFSVMHFLVVLAAIALIAWPVRRIARRFVASKREAAKRALLAEPVTRGDVAALELEVERKLSLMEASRAPQTAASGSARPVTYTESVALLNAMQRDLTEATRARDALKADLDRARRERDAATPERVDLRQRINDLSDALGTARRERDQAMRGRDEAVRDQNECWSRSTALAAQLDAARAEAKLFATTPGPIQETLGGRLTTLRQALVDAVAQLEAGRAKRVSVSTRQSALSQARSAIDTALVFLDKLRGESMSAEGPFTVLRLEGKQNGFETMQDARWFASTLRDSGNVSRATSLIVETMQDARWFASTLRDSGNVSRATSLIVDKHGHAVAWHPEAPA